MKTKVQFLVNENYGEFPDIFAFFPEEYYNREAGETMKISYSHIGQHSACCDDYANESREATEEEYKPLYDELTKFFDGYTCIAGYDLEIIRR